LGGPSEALESSLVVEPPPDEHRQGYQRAELITADELALIKRVDRQLRAKFESILVTDGRQYALLFLNLLQKLARADTMQNILVLIGDALTGWSEYGGKTTRADVRTADHDERIPLFLDAAKLDPELPYAPFLKCATRSE
jgi:V-type H+-transporting ATPase subunit H